MSAIARLDPSPHLRFVLDTATAEGDSLLEIIYLSRMGKGTRLDAHALNLRTFDSTTCLRTSSTNCIHSFSLSYDDPISYGVLETTFHPSITCST